MSGHFDFGIRLKDVALWEFSNSPNLMGLLELNQQWIDANYTAFWNDWLANVFDLRTANDFGLAVWAVILQVPLYTQSDLSPPDYPAFGFNDFGENFDNGNFAVDADPSLLNTEQKRKILQVRYFQLVSNQNVRATNKFLAFVFGSGVIYATSNQDMTVTYTMSSTINQTLRDSLVELEVLPVSAGVKLLTEVV